MFEHIVVIFYNFAVFCGVCNLSLAGLLIYKKESENIKKLFWFLLFFFVYGFLNMLAYYRVHIVLAESIVQYYVLVMTMVYVLMNCMWLDYIMELNVFPKEKARNWIYFGCGICIVLWAVDSLVFMGDQLNVINETGNRAATIVECAAIVVMGTVSLKSVYKGAAVFYQKIETVFVLLFFLYITIKDIRISFFNYNIETYSVSSWSFCAVFCFLTNIVTLIYLVRMFISFIESAHRDKQEIHLLEMTAEEIKEKYSVSGREKEVLLLIYKGKNNTEIAEELFISLNTVKKHINSLFKKLGVSSRAEIISKIRLKDF